MVADDSHVLLVGRRDDHDPVALPAMPAEPRRRVVTQPALDDPPRQFSSMALEIVPIHAAQTDLARNRPQRVSITPRSGGKHPMGTARQASDQSAGAGNPSQEWYDAVSSGQRGVEVERGDRAEGHPNDSASIVQNPGQLFDTTSGSSTSMPSTTEPNTANAIASRWS